MQEGKEGFKKPPITPITRDKFSREILKMKTDVVKKFAESPGISPKPLPPTLAEETIRANQESANAAREEERRRDKDATEEKWRIREDDERRKKEMMIPKSYEMFPDKDAASVLSEEIRRANADRTLAEGLETIRRAQDKLRKK